MTHNEKMMLSLCGGLFAIILLGFITIMTGHDDLARWVPFITAVWMFGWFGFVLVFDSRRRWPHNSVRERAHKLLTFTR